MSLQSEPIGSIPAETVRIARAACPKGTLAMRLRERLGSIFEDEQFRALSPRRGQGAQAPWQLALVTLLQFVDGLTDRQAADAVRERIAWKYALGLELSDPGFDFSVLCEFRTRLVQGQAENLLLEALLQECEQHGWRNRRRTATHGLDACGGGHRSAQRSGGGGPDAAGGLRRPGGGGPPMAAGAGQS